ncbi:hypothetical protein ACYOEI_33410 [Singulisphaera rosea]
MPPSDLPHAEPSAQDSTLRRIDWRGWIILAWVVWFAFLYGKMVIAERGSRLQNVVTTKS